jgi:hypothetical protein
LIYRRSGRGSCTRCSVFLRADRSSDHFGLSANRAGVLNAQSWRLIIVWLEVRVLPAPPRSLAQTEISRFVANSPELAAIRIRNLAPLPLSSVACGLLPKRSPPSSELGASHSCASAPITSGPLRRRTKGPPRPQPWRNSISMKAAQAVSGARAGSQQLSLGGADASNVFHLRRTRTNAARRSAR